jgi:WW domain-containing oxidoreductase
MAQAIPFGSRSTADQVLAGVDLTRKRMLVTECNSSIGYAIMQALSANGAHIIGLARRLDDAQVACSAAGRSLTPLGCNPTDRGSVDVAVQSIRGLGPLDAVVINCVELRYVADHMAQMALVNGLSELVRGGTGRIVIGSSDNANIIGHRVEDAMLDNLSGERLYDSYAFDGQAELATALFTKELSRRLDARGVAVNSFRCGATGNRTSRAQRLIQSIARHFTKSPAQRAATPALLAASPLVVGMTGEYWSNCQMSRGNPLHSDIGLAKRLWEASARIAAIAFGGGTMSEAASFRLDSLRLTDRVSAGEPSPQPSSDAFNGQRKSLSDAYAHRDQGTLRPRLPQSPNGRHRKPRS